MDALGGVLPTGWGVDLVSGAATEGPLLRIRAPDGAAGTLRLCTRSVLAPRDVRALGTAPEGPPRVVVAPYLSPATRVALEEVGLGYVDLTGSIRLALDRPGLFLAAPGADRDPRPERRPSRSLSGGKAGRIVRALIEAAEPPGVRELAERTETDPGYVSRVVALLDREALVEPDRRGRIAQVAWRR
ncbi:MAG TPA: hypothetical protein VJP77_06890, partial [Planctomycetota bacterium]|nr:hypothetical protein [Planctomycetota bacterium]